MKKVLPNPRSVFKSGAASAAFMYAVSAGVNRLASGGKITEDDKLNAKASSCAYRQSQTCGSMTLQDSGSNRNGFKWAAYQNADGSGPVRVAYAGTDDLMDVWADIIQALGIKTEQYEMAIATAKDFQETYGGNVVLTGHSLGGGLASAAAHATGLRATTFNAAGLSWRYGGFSNNSSIRAFYNSSDALNAVQDLTMGILIPGAAGSRIMLGTWGVNGLHQMSGVCGAMGMGSTCGVQ